MSDEKKIIFLDQEEGEQLSHLHNGGVAVYGDAERPALKHEHHVGQILHGTAPQHPLVHMVCWEEEQVCKVEVEGRIVLAGDEKAPVNVQMMHTFPDAHHQKHDVAPLDHTLHLDTRLSSPIHHALQMRTPLQLRFCNAWHIASDYILRINIGKTEWGSIRLTGATIATPQPCEEEKCPEPRSLPPHP